MSRFKLTIEYDGGPFQGWQRQDHAPTVQGAIETAAETLNGAIRFLSWPPKRCMMNFMPALTLLNVAISTASWIAGLD